MIDNGSGKAKTNLELPEHSSEVIVIKLTLIFLHTYETGIYILKLQRKIEEEKMRCFTKTFFKD